MKIKRRWKAMAILPMIWCVIGLSISIPLFEHGYEAWIEAYGSSLLLFGGWFLGTITGVIMFVGAIDAEEREKAEWKFQDDVYTMYEDYQVHKLSKEDSINKTATYYDTSPSAVRNIVRIYKDD